MGRVTSRIIQWASEEQRLQDLWVLNAVTDIDRISAQLAPKLTRALVKSRKVKRKGLAHYTVTFGNSQVPYARRRHFENNKNPQTTNYLGNAGDVVYRNFELYKPR